MPHQRGTASPSRIRQTMTISRGTEMYALQEALARARQRELEQLASTSWQARELRLARVGTHHHSWPSFASISRTWRRVHSGQM